MNPVNASRQYRIRDFLEVSGALPKLKYTNTQIRAHLI